MRKYLLLLLLCLFSPLLVCGLSSGDDMLSKVFNEAVYKKHVLNLGNSKKSVGQSVTQSQTTRKIGSGGVDKQKSDPLLVRIADVFLKFTVALSVTMIIYNAIIYASKVLGGEDYKSKDSMKQLQYVVFGILLALFSVVIINLIRSLSYSVISGYSF